MLLVPFQEDIVGKKTTTHVERFPSRGRHFHNVKCKYKITCGDPGHANIFLDLIPRRVGVVLYVNV